MEEIRSKVKNIEDCSRQIDIEVSPEVVKRKFDEVYGEIQKVANIPGYRTGKAPRDILEKHHKKDAESEVLKDLVPEYYAKALGDNKLDPVELPKISEISLKKDGSLVFKAVVSVRPNVSLKDYKAIKIKKKKAAVEEEDVDKYLVALQDMNARYAVVQDRALESGDYIVCDLKCTVEEKCLDDKKNAWLSIDDKYLLKGLKEGLIGMKIGEQKVVEVTIPKDYPQKEYAEKKAVFDITLHQIKKKELLPLNDDFAKDMGEFKSLDELRENVKKDIAHKKEREAKLDMENQLLGALVRDNSGFSLPTSLVERQLEGLVEDAKARLSSRGFKKEDVNSKTDEFKSNLRQEAEKRVRLYFLLDEISRKEHITVSEEEVNSTLQAIAKQYNKTFDEIKHEYEERDLIDGLAEDLRETKVIDFLLKEAVIKEE